MKVFLYIRVACADQLAAADQREELERAMRRTKAMRWLLLWRQTASPASIRKVS